LVFIDSGSHVETDHEVEAWYLDCGSSALARRIVEVGTELDVTVESFAED
jgi:hypothetical protein